MNIKIIEYTENKNIGSIKLRNNATTKTISSKVKEYIESNYNCTIRRALPTGVITPYGSNISYVLFGDNLPFRQYYIAAEK